VSRLLDHLERQVESSRRLLELVLDQNAAIRDQDVWRLLGSLGEVQAEMAYRARLEAEREELLLAAAAERGAAPETLDLEALLAGTAADEAARARERSAELLGLVTEVERVHAQNRVLVRQELAFLDHLMRALSGTPRAGYSPSGWTAVPPLAAGAVDARA